ncbi:MAG TPA: cupin domain-containing protein [Planctomycetota bacterium]
MKISWIAILAAVAVFPCAAQEPVVTKAADVKWGPHPSVPGAFSAVQSGDPSKGACVVMMKFPKGATIPAHFHTASEVVTVVSGTAVFGAGEKVDLSKGVELGAGSFIQVPSKSPHWAFAKEDFIITVNFSQAVDFHLCEEKK